MSVDSIHKAPVFEAFSHKCGCPICRIYDRYEKNAINTLMLEGVMDYNIRTMTNQQGFCDKHMQQICYGKDSLSAALMFTTYMEQHMKEVAESDNPAKVKKAYQGILNGCYICTTVDRLMAECAEFISCLYNEDSFRKVFCEQEFFCAKHTFELLNNAKLPKKVLAAYVKDIKTVNLNYSAKTMKKLEAYSTSFDYRNAGKNVNDVKDCNKDVYGFLK